MLEILSDIGSGVDAIIILKLFVALLLGMLIGAERTISHKTAGLKTFGLVAMASCLFIIVAISILPLYARISPTDIMRVMAGVITGIGFLGAGIIIFRESKETITGLSTAAGLWVAAGIGAAIGFEQYVVAVAATILTLLTFSFFQWIENKVIGFADGDT